MKTTLKTIYLTLLHAGFAAMVFLYTSDNYSLVKIDHPKAEQTATCCNGDELTALLDSKLVKGRK